MHNHQLPSNAETSTHKIGRSSANYRYDTVTNPDHPPDCAKHKKMFFYCGPGRKRYLIALLCTIGLTVVIGMRAEILGIVSKLTKNHTQLKSFDPIEHKPLPWTKNVELDLVENSVFFAYLVASPIGGLLTVNHDSSLLLGCSVAMTCGINLFLPLVDNMSESRDSKIQILIFLRLLQGLAEGCLIPAVFGVLRFWSPLAERSTLFCLAVIGVSLGPLIGLPICKMIEQRWGSAVVFYIYANLGLIWCIFWWRLIDEKPSKDKSLSSHERFYLESSITPRVLQANRNIRIPWRALFSSQPVYAIFFTYAADDWTFQISTVCMQSFYNSNFKTKISEIIFLLLIPFLARSLLVPVGGFIADILQLKSGLSLTVIRKILAVLGFGLKAVFFVALGFAKDEIMATVLLSLALGFSGLAVAGYAVNVIDLAPNFAGLIMGFANSISTFTGFLSTVIATVVVEHIASDKTSGWILAMCMAAGIQIFSMTVYLMFASCVEQPWAFETDQSLLSPTVTSFQTNRTHPSTTSRPSSTMKGEVIDTMVMGTQPLRRNDRTTSVVRTPAPC